MKEESRKIIRKCATLCKKSYDKAKMTQDGFQSISSDETGLDCFIKSEDGITWVVFRGTETNQMNDVCTDLLTFRVKTPFLPDECRVHVGFLGQYTSGRTSIMDAVKFMANPKVVCTGHSLGGALSTLCALDVEHNAEGDVETYCVTYGSPRVGGGHFCRLFDAVIDNSFRFVDVNDPIPRVPLRAWGFKHVKGCFVTSPYGYKPDLEQLEASSLACCAVADHGIDLYEAAVNFTPSAEP
jgi:predicted lipase